MKTSNKKILLAAIMGCSMITLTGCNDWLTKEPLSSVSPEDYFTKESSLLAFVDGRYTEFLPTHGGSSSTDGYDYGMFQWDATTDNQINASAPDDKYLGLWRVPQTGGGYSFSNIYKCNWFLQQVMPKYEKGEISGVKENIDHYIGEIYFLRAYQYFQLLQKFGDYPIVTEPLTDSKDELVAASKRAPCDSVARFILQDLDKAIAYMSETEMANSRISATAAYLLQSRVALFEGSWLKNFAGTAFVPCTSEWPGNTKEYNANYQFPRGSATDEANWFFEQAMKAAKEVATRTSLTPNTGIVQQSETDAPNPYMDMFASEDLFANTEVLLWCPYGPNLVGHSVVMYAQRGNNNTGLTRGYVDSYLMKDGLPIYASPLYKGDTSFVAVRTDRDTRLSCFLKEPGQRNYIYATTESNNAIEIEPVPQFTGVIETYATGYSIRKGNSIYQKQCQQRGSTTGCVVFRSAEALLNYIEACYERNGSLDADATEYWKLLRARAGVDEDFNKTIAATDMSIEARNDWGAYTAGVLIDPTLYNIRRERRSELMAEGLRYMDLIRWRSLDQLITTPYHVEGIHVWSTGMQHVYAEVINTDGSKGVEFKYGDKNANVSSPTDSEWFRPYRMVDSQQGYDGLSWKMAHYLYPINAKEFLLTSSNGSDKETSPLYQNPYWSKDADTAPEK